MEEQATTLLVIALGAFAVPLLSGRIGVPAAVGEIAFGILVGPYVLAIVSEVPTVAESGSFFQFLAEFGVVFLLFAIGLEFSLPQMIAMKGAVFGLGGSQVLLTSLVAGGIAWLLP